MQTKSSSTVADIPLKGKLHNETAKIAWAELQTFFAQGLLLLVQNKIDLIEVAIKFSEDQAVEIKKMLDDGRVGPPNNDQAREWYANKTELWSVVVAPFVLVQEQR